MGKLLDKLERASRGTIQPLGFGSARREKVAPLLLLGAVEAGNDAQAKLVAAAELDGAIVLGNKGAKATDVDKSAKALKDVTFGVWAEEATPSGPDGSDFQVFSSEATPAGALSGEERTTLMQVDPDLDDSLLRTIEYLPVDGFLVSLMDADSLTVRQLMRLGRVRGMTSRWLLAYLPALPTKEELEQLRDVGVSGIVVGLAGETAASLKGCRQALLELPHEAPDRKKSRSIATLPSLAAPGPAPSRPGPEPEPDPDDDDWDEP